jgi:iron(III) transport system substrate-binding protein
MKPALSAACLVLFALLCAAAAPPGQPSGHLVLYTSQPDRIAAQTVAAFRAADPAVTVTVFRSGTTQLMNKLAAEFLAGRPQPDVLLIADAMSMEALKEQGRLAPDPTVDVSAFPPALYDPDRTWFGTKLITTGIVYNTHAPFIPRAWSDLLRPAARGETVLPSPLYSGAALITTGAFAQYPPLGPDFLARLAGAGAIAVAGNGGVLTAVAGGQRMFGLLVDFMALNAKKEGSPVGFVFPAEGVPAVTEPVAILKTAKNPEAARAFVAFLLSVRGQQLAASQGFLPARRGIAPPPGFPPPGFSSLSQIHLLPMDIPKILAHRRALEENFSNAFGD